MTAQYLQPNYYICNYYNDHLIGEISPELSGRGFEWRQYAAELPMVRLGYRTISRKYGGVIHRRWRQWNPPKFVANEANAPMVRLRVVQLNGRNIVIKYVKRPMVRPSRNLGFYGMKPWGDWTWFLWLPASAQWNKTINRIFFQWWGWKYMFAANEAACPWRFIDPDNKLELWHKKKSSSRWGSLPMVRLGYCGSKVKPPKCTWWNLATENNPEVWMAD